MAEREPNYWEVSWKFEGEDFEKLRSMVEEVTYSAQENIFDQGDPADGMYLLLDGYALVIQRQDDGSERTIGIVSAGQSFGELGVLIEQPRMGAVAAGTDCHVLRITPKQLDEIETNAPHIAAMLYRELAKTLAEQMVGFLRSEHGQ